MDEDEKIENGGVGGGSPSRIRFPDDGDGPAGAGGYGSLANDDDEGRESGSGEDEATPMAAPLSSSGRRRPPGGRGTRAARQRGMFDSWLRRDDSARTFGSGGGGMGGSWMGGSGTRGGGGLSASILSVGSSIMGGLRSVEDFLGPTDRSVEEIIREERMASGAGGVADDDEHPSTLKYKSADRRLVDTFVWHRRKAKLLEKVKGSALRGEGEDRSFLLDDGRGGRGGEAYAYDADAVRIIEGRRTNLDRLIVVGIGVAMAVTGVFVSRTADDILEFKIDRSLDRFEPEGFLSGMICYVGWSSLFALGAFLPVAVRPVSAGSGIAEAKATLNGVIVPQCTALPTALCKGLSVMLSVAASLPAGLEGPMIHLGLCIGDNFNRVVPRNKAEYDPLRLSRSQIDYAAIGTAAGVSAAFRSPVSGVLFAMEEGSSFWSTSLTWRCFQSACVCVVTLYFLLGCLDGNFTVKDMALFSGGAKDAASMGDESTLGYTVPDFEFWEYLLFVAVGGAGGLIGGAFCMTNRSLAILRRRLSLGKFYKGLEVVIIATVAATLTWSLPSVPFLTSCHDLSDAIIPSHHFRQYGCPDGQYNELATLLLNPLGGGGITLLFNEGPAAFSIRSCCVAGVLHLVVLCVSFGMSVSAGIFIPLLFVGACLGRALGTALGLDARTYAIVGAAATLGGVVRVLISLTAIVTHTTSLGHFMTPVMVATLLAQNVGNWFSDKPGIYDIILQLRGVPFLEEEPPHSVRHANVRARNVMRRDLVALGTQVNVGELVRILRKNDMSTFPIADEARDGSLLGSISRSDLLAVLSRPDVFFSEDGGGEEDDDDGTGGSAHRFALPYDELEAARPPPEAVPSPDEIGSGLTESDLAKYVHLAPYAQIAPHTFGGHGSAERAYEMFRSLGLRVMFIVDKKYRPIGVITRHELALLEEIGMRETKVRSKRRQSRMYTSLTQFHNHFE